MLHFSYNIFMLLLSKFSENKQIDVFCYIRVYTTLVPL